jgi:ABC-type nitrate/sulfonate/bicarbonate transport system substrate-binding protein
VQHDGLLQALTKSLAFALALAFAFPSLARAEPIEVILPETGNLQYLAFWVAAGSSDVDLKLRVAETPGDTPKLVDPAAAQLFVLPPPILLQLLADGAPLVAVANLLRNDPIDLIVKREVARARKLDAALPLKERLERMRGLKLGVAPGPIPRLRTLYQSVGLPVPEVVTLMGQEQNGALADGKVEALYAHTPYLERALMQQDCVVVVNQAGGEVPELASRQIHTLVANDKMLREKRPTVDKMIAAIAHAERLIHHDRAAALAALFRALPPKDAAARALAEKLFDLYANAIPEDPAVSVEGLKGALTFYPASKRPPDLSHLDWARHVLTPTRPRR